ncbi:hypothetical protein GCM10025864_34890 [Luteimicrobium album]|uniref:Uncharacterized protein n=1 Tax=Luteimicrobium album TaxID=1054550 RepID=A0ABQ6I5H0_9MICO|nr:hypothetical protein [Luteimicrobium album]GMA25730.1 hypothetical protein GCM10025864_34890 [Luteimicrobium album]
MPEPYYFRDFLNAPGHHAGAYVLASVGVDDDLAFRSGPHLDASLTVADCGRVVTLDFDCYDADSLENALHKARLLRKTLDEFVSAFEEHAQRFRRELDAADEGSGAGRQESAHQASASA